MVAEETTRNRSGLSLRPILIISLISQIILTVGLTGYFSWKNGQKTVQSLAMRLSREVTFHTEQHVENYINIPTIFLKINQAFVNSGNLNIKDFINLEHNFLLQSQLITQINTIYFGSKTGDFIEIEMQQPPKIAIRDRFTAPYWEIYQINEQGQKIALIKKEKFDPRVRPWYQAASKAKRLVWSSVYLFADPPVLGITSAMPILDKQTQTTEGVIGIDLTLQEISEFLNTLQISDSGKAFIVEDSGELVATSTTDSLVTFSKQANDRVDYAESQDSLISATGKFIQDKFGDLRQIKSEQQLILRFNRQRYFVQITPFNNHTGLNWSMVVIIPELDFREHIRNNTYTTILLCSAALLLATFLGAMINQWLFRTVARLSQTSNSISRGELELEELEERMAVPQIRELAVVAQSFNSLARQLQTSTQNLANTNTMIEKRVAQKTKKLQQTNQQLQRLVVIDSLTQVYNRYYFDLTLNQLWWKNLISEQPIALIMCDVDYFKIYNDTYGHQQGDRCLRQIAQIIAGTFQRNEDIVARYGGEEFVVILPNTGILGAMEIATRIKDRVQEARITHNFSQVSNFVTVSCGVTSAIPNIDSDCEALIAQADRALYQAKNRGRNQIVYLDS